MTDTDEWLQSLSSEQLDLVKNRLLDIQKERKHKVRHPGAASAEDLAAAQGLDLSALMREISKR